MVTYQQLARDPVSRVLFESRIRTLEMFRKIQDKNTAFLALDTEHFSVESEQDRVLHQVGLAFMTSIPQKASTGASRLQDFYTGNQVEVLTLNIAIPKERRDRINHIRGGLPARRPLRLGQEQQVQQADLEAAVIQFVHKCSTAMADPESLRLVLVAFWMAAEWEYLSKDFPKLMCHLSAWVDLRDIGQDIAQKGVLPSLTTTLQLLGHSRKDLKPGRQDNSPGTADNAGDDAVATLVLAQHFFQSESQEKLRFRQACGQIAGMFTRTKASRHQMPRPTQFPFTAIIKSQSHSFHPSINSGVRLARTFFHFVPTSVGIVSENTAYLTFKIQSELEFFIEKTDGLVLSHGEPLSVSMYRASEEFQEKEAKEQKEKQASREKKRSTRAEEEEMEDIGDLFGW